VLHLWGQQSRGGPEDGAPFGPEWRSATGVGKVGEIVVFVLSLGDADSASTESRLVPVSRLFSAWPRLSFPPIRPEGCRNCGRPYCLPVPRFLG